MSITLTNFVVSPNVQAAAGINKQISFQGKVVNTDGTNVTNGSYTFLFCLYTTSSPSTACTSGANNDAVWRESKSLTVTDGIFQSNLGDTTTLPGSVDFNTDNIYLGINFNSDGQMSPLVRFTAAPYAMNADKVHGLSVTDTTGTLTIPNGKTISFADAFATSGAFATTLTATGTTNVTLPTTGTLATLAGSEILTNKTIGSTGLTFSGATTDITTAAGEDLTLNSGTTGAINIGTDASAETINIGNTGAAVKTIAIGNNSQANTITIGDASVTGLSLTDNNWSINTSGVASFITGSSIGSLTFTTNNIADSGALTIKSATTNALTLDSGTTGTVNIATGTSGKTVNIGSALDDVAITGDQWSITNAGVLTVVSCSGCGGGSTLDSAYTAGNTITTDSGNNVIVTLQEVATPTSFVVENQDTAGVSAQRIFNSITSGTLTNGLLIEQTGAGTLTNGIQIAETAGTITDGILITGTLGNILNSGSIDITGAGAITGATGITSSGTITFSGFTSNGGPLYTNGSGVLAQVTAGTSSQVLHGGTTPSFSAIVAGDITADSLDFTELKDSMTLDASTDIAVTGSNVFSITNSGSGNSFVVNDASGDTTPFIIDATGVAYFNGTSSGITIDGANTILATTTPQDFLIRTAGGGSDLVIDSGHNIGIGTASPNQNLEIFGAANAGLRFNSGASSIWDITTNYGIASDLVVSRPGGAGDFVVSGANVGIGDTTPDALLDFDFASTNATAGTEYGAYFTTSDTGVVTTGTDTTYGVRNDVTRTGATGGTINTIGEYIAVTADSAGAGTSTAYGIYATATGADTNYGAYLASSGPQLYLYNTSGGAYATFSVNGAGNLTIAPNGGGTVASGSFGVNDATPDSPLEILSTSQQLRLSYTDGSVDGLVYVDSNEYLTLAAGTTSEINRVQIGAGGAGNSTPDFFGLDVKSDTGDPAGGFEGAMYYNTFDNKFRCYQNSGWTDCVGSGGSGYSLIKDETTGLTAQTTLAFLGAGVSCVDNVTQTECTISGGAGSDLQGTYDADANGSNVTISLTAADDGLVFTNPTSGGTDGSTFLLSLTQQHTTAAVTVLDMVQSSNAANGVNLTANSIDGETGLAITTNGLTSGKGISITSSATAFTGNLADISLSGSNASNTGKVLAVSNTGTANANTTLFVDHRATGTGNLAMRVDDQSGDTTPFIIDGDGRVGIGTSTISSSASSERLLQVGSETNRGNSVTYGEVVTKGLEDYTALANIKDVFVYDTTADSDGGRWIDWATTDNLSWYTETLDDGPSDPCNIATDDRCYSEAFPRKAILVVTTDALYIFDAATNAMWMKFSQNASGYALGVDTNNDPSSVTAMNGVIYVGANGTAPGGLYVFDFVGDRMWNYNGSGRSGASVGIGSRNTALSYNVDTDAKLDISQVGTAAEWEKVNDVFVQVVSQSMVTQATGAATNLTAGYGKTFVALATDSGVTIINLAAQTLLQYSDVTADDYTAVHITRRGRLYALNTTQDQLERWDDIDSDKASEVNGTYTRKWDETVSTGPALASSAFNIIAGAPDALEVVERGSVTLESEDIIYVGHSLGLAELHDHTTQAFGWVKYFNQTRETPLMILAGINDMVLPMDDTSGTQAQDLSIANTDMAIVGSPTLGVDGVQGKAIQFDNTNDYLCSDANSDNTCDVDTAFNMSTVGWTLSLWFKHSTTAPASAADTIFEKCVTAAPAAATGCVIAYMTTTGTIVVANDTDAVWTRPDVGAASYNITATSTLTYNDNQWHHLVLSRTNANDLDSWIDGAGMNLSTATGGTTTFDGSQIVTIGASCSLSTGANCAAANVVNVWDGAIDDVQFVVGTTTQATLSATQVRRLYNAERPRANKKTITVTDATSATSTSLTDTGESWNVNEFSGLVMEITGSSDSDCVGLTRRVVSNTSNTLTFAPAVPGACTLDTSADFQVDPEALYGASDAVYAIAISAEAPLGEARQMCVGTNDGADGGGITCYNHQAGPSIIADVYHSGSSQTDDSGTDWTGTNYDNIRSIDISLNGRTMVIGSQAHFFTQTGDVRLGQGLDYLAYQIFKIRGEIILDGITAAGSNGLEVGFTGGADLAENYYSDAPLAAGSVVALDKERPAYVADTASAYQKDMLGVVATSPGMVLGDPSNNGYPIALVGRVPVKVTNENGPIYAGDRLTSSSRSGYAMRATQAGRVLGETLSDATDWTVCDGEDPADVNAKLCTTVLVFVNLTDYSGQSVELALAEKHPADPTLGSDGLVGSTAIDGVEQGLGSETASVRLATSAPTKQEQILSFLKEMRDKEAGKVSSEMFTGRLSASTEVITPTLYADQIFAKSIRADSIEGLSIWTDQIASLKQKYAGLEADAAGSSATDAPVTTEKTLLNLEQFSVGSLTVSLDTTMLGKLALSGGMTVGGDASFAGDTVFAKLASFFGSALFKGAVSFEKAPSFGSDTAGFATIEEGAKKVRVTFDTPYAKQPIVAVSLTRDESPLLSEADDSLKADIRTVEKEYLDTVFKEDIRYVVTEKSVSGFTIVLSSKAPRDLQFSWVALSVDKAKSFNSEKEKTEETVPPDPVPAPLPVPDAPVDTTPVSVPETVTGETVPTVDVPLLTPTSPETTTP